jgi:hypothetical protein
VHAVPPITNHKSKRLAYHTGHSLVWTT